VKLRWTTRARRDLIGIGRYIARDDPAAAHRWIVRLRQRARAAARRRLSGRVVPELQRADVREVLLRNYRLVYRLRDNEIHMLTVFEGHRRFPAEDLPHTED